MASTKGLKPGDRRYSADTNEWEIKEKKTKPTPASNTRKKARAAALKNATKGATAAVAAGGKKKKKAAPKPEARSKRPATVKESPIPKGNDSSPGGKAKAKIYEADAPKKKAAMTASADAKVRADAAREERIKKSKGSAADMVYARRVTGRKAW